MLRLARGGVQLRRSISYKPKYSIVIADVESTGLSPARDRIIEIGAVKLVDGVIIGCFSSLINPGVKVTPTITQITKITQEMVDKAPSTGSVLIQFSEFMADNIFVAHNSNYDASIIVSEMNRHGIPLSHCFKPPKSIGLKITKTDSTADTDLLYLENPTILCTLKIAKRLLPNLPAYKLIALAEHFKLPPSETHRALSDCQITAKIFQMLHIEATRRLGYTPKVEFFSQLGNTPLDRANEFIASYSE
jgi:DNA polymerase III epsilon subunit-like protein